MYNIVIQYLYILLNDYHNESDMILTQLLTPAFKLFTIPSAIHGFYLANTYCILNILMECIMHDVIQGSQ